MHNIDFGIKYILKRDGRKDNFNTEKIISAIDRATLGDKLSPNEMQYILTYISNYIKKTYTSENIITVETIQQIIESALENTNHKNILISYSDYRKQRNKIRDKKSSLMNTIKQIGVCTDRDNANVGNNFSSKLLRIASESNKWQTLSNMPKELAKLHENGDLYYHDLDSYNLTINCLHVPTKELLLSGFNTGYGTINPAKRIGSAAELSCIILQSSQNDMFGGQSHPDFDNDMAVFIEPTRQEIIADLESLGVPHSKIPELAEVRVRKFIHQAMQGVVYNLNTMHSRAGSQVPFSSINLGIPYSRDAALICEIFLTEYEKGLGKGEQPIFPNIIFRVKQGVNRDKNDEYFYLYKLACKVAAKRMNPTFMNIDASFNKEYYDKGIMPATMGCRTYIMKNVNGEAGCKGRGNIAPTTINLPKVALLANGNLDKFFNLLNTRLYQAKDSLIDRYKTLKKLKVKDLPFVAGQKLLKGSENLNENDTIEPILKQGTWGIGFIGLAETLISLIGKHHGESEEARILGLKIVQTIRNFCDKMTDELHLNFSCYATPAEGLSGKFIVNDKELFGEISGVTDKEYYTNSFHIPVSYPISICDKLAIEAPYHELCNGGHISYIEVDDSPSYETIMDILNYAYTHTNIGYLGINFHIRYCKKCGSSLHASDGDTCPCCGSNDIQGISRVTGYLSLDERFGPGKYHERHDRISHNDFSKHVYSNL